MDKKKIKLLLLGIVFVLIVIFAFNIVKINCEYRQAKNVSIPINTKEKVNDSLAMTVIDAKLLNMEESTAEYGNDIVDEEDDVEFKKFMDLFTDWYNNSPQYMLGGYSPIEFRNA